MTTGEALSVLIVDDDASFREVLVDVAARAGYQVLSCGDGGEALELVRRQSVDLVITDLVMPGPDGLEVLKAVRQHRPEALVIIITGHASLQTAIEAIREGAYDYIRKPFKLEEMELAIKNVGERIRLLRENKRLLAELQQAYEQVSLVKEIVEISSPQGREADTDFCGGLRLSWQRGEPFIPDNRLPLSYLRVRKEPLDSVLGRLERLGVLLEKGFLSETEFRTLKAKLLGSP
jgi:DNA-binding response OmpR family regulator